MMKKKSLIAFIAVIVILVIWCVTQYNGIITYLLRGEMWKCSTSVGQI